MVTMAAPIADIAANNWSITRLKRRQMYRTDLKAMADLVIQSGLVDKSKKAFLVDVLAAYWSDRIADVWTVEDLQDVWTNLTDEEAMCMLNKALHNFDTEYGINWEVLSHYLPEDYLPNDDDQL
jgi:hypothetical protein